MRVLRPQIMPPLELNVDDSRCRTCSHSTNISIDDHDRDPYFDIRADL